TANRAERRAQEGCGTAYWTSPSCHVISACPAAVWGWNIMSRSERDHCFLPLPAPAGAVTGPPGGAADRPGARPGLPVPEKLLYHGGRCPLPTCGGRILPS